MSEYFKQACTLLSPEKQEKEWYEEVEEQVCSICPALTFQQRIIGCFTCLLVGFLISMGSTFRLIKLMEGDPEPFAIMYTIGNILGLCSTCFLYGPVSQMKQMFAATRLGATAIYLFFMATTLFLAFYPEYIPIRVLWLIISIFFQFLALMWYSLSYIPFAREIAKTMFQQTCGKGCCCADQQQEEGYWSQL